MGKPMNLVDIGLKDYKNEDKREVFMILDQVMKNLHENNMIITSFDPKDIIYENSEFVYTKVSPMSPIVASDKQSAVVDNVIKLANLALCFYLPNYDFNSGLLDPRVLKNNYRAYENVFDPIDKAYYRSVLVDTFTENKIPPILYYYDYVSATLKDSDLSDRNNSNVRSYVKATEAGRLMTDKNSESAFSTTFALTSMVAAALILIIGLALYFLK